MILNVMLWLLYCVEKKAGKVRRQSNGRILRESVSWYKSYREIS
jgi:hypothetical protein